MTENKHTLDAAASGGPISEKLARTFARILGDWLTPDEQAEVLQRNGSEEYSDGCCASHDFCDANQAMLDAFDEHGVDWNDAAASEDLRVSNLWDRAWTIAKAAGFWLDA